MTDKTLHTLEYPKILAQVAKFAGGEPAKSAMLDLRPDTHLVTVQAQLDLTEQADLVLYDHCVSPDFSYDDVSEELLLLSKSVTLAPMQLLKCARLLRSARTVRQAIVTCNDARLRELQGLAYLLHANHDTEEDIFRSVCTDGTISDQASSALRDVRRNIRLCNERIRQKLDSFISGGTYAGVLQDNLITMRNNRYVIPLKSECKGQIDGLVHDRSASGATLYVEPIAIVRMNNELRTLQLEEEKEIAIVLERLSFALAQDISAIETSYQMLIQLDCIFAKAAYGHSLHAVRPHLNTQGIVKIYGGRHPLIDKNKVVPVSIQIGDPDRTLIITGPNTGGKTVTLKLTGVLSLMAMSGIFVPAQPETELCVWSGVYCDIGDEQSIEQSLSTYSSHITNLIGITRSVEENSLVLLDELGAGTDPAEGSALAIAVIEYLRQKGCVTLTTSHYTELKQYSASTPGVASAGMDFDPVTFAPTYRLIPGVSGSSNALAIARNLGLDPSIIDTAKSYIGSDRLKYDELIAAAERERRLAHAQLEEAKQMREQQEEIVRSMQSREQALEEKTKKLEEKLSLTKKELAQDYIEQAEDLIEQIKANLKRSDEQALFAARKLKKSLEDRSQSPMQSPQRKKLDGPIEVGDRVWVKSLRAEGEVIACNPKKKEYTVKAGILTSAVKASDVYKIQANAAQNVEVRVRKTGDKAREACPSELMLIGMNSDEALYRCEQYLSDALMYGHTQVRIVHGKGSGILRKAIRQMLQNHPAVQEFRAGVYGEGEDGVTIVTLK